MEENKKTMLNAICISGASLGAFSGMIFNAKLSNPNKSIEELIDLALDCRVKVVELSK